MPRPQARQAAQPDKPVTCIATQKLRSNDRKIPVYEDGAFDEMKEPGTRSRRRLSQSMGGDM